MDVEVEGRRRCPVDHAELDERILQALGDEVIVDQCGRCGGVFLDADELLELGADARLNEALRERHPTDETSVRMCPSCSVRMVMEEAPGVELEACPKCAGLWLDGGELEKLLGRAPPQRGG